MHEHLLIDDLVERIALLQETRESGSAASSTKHQTSAFDRDLLRAHLSGSSSLSQSELNQGLVAAGVEDGNVGEALNLLSAVINSETNGAVGPDGPDVDTNTKKTLGKLKVSELRSRLLDLDQATSGLKKDLVERLHSAMEKAQQPPDQSSVGPSAALNEKTRGPVILILDECLQRLPWESMSFLKSNPISRAPSMSFVFRHGLQALARPGVAGTGAPPQHVFKGIQLQKAHYILDPEGNLPRTRASLGPLLEAFSDKLGWSGAVGEGSSSEDSVRSVESAHLSFKSISLDFICNLTHRYLTTGLIYWRKIWSCIVAMEQASELFGAKSSKNFLAAQLYF